MIIINLKTYTQATGTELKETLDALESFTRDHADMADKLMTAPQLIDLYYAADNSRAKLVSQHCDAIESGKGTGKVSPERLLNIGVNYTMLNHSENRFQDFNDLIDTVAFVQAQNVEVIVCCENSEEAERLLQVKPYAIAYEPKELIGSGKAVSEYKPEEVKQFISTLEGKSIPVIGAGVSNGEDIKSGLELGAKGFLLASAFAKAPNKYEKLVELFTPYINY
jgi:triosephosphate isomerase